MADPISIPPLESSGDQLPRRQPSADADDRDKKKKPKPDAEHSPTCLKSSSDENVGRSLDLEL